MKTKLSVADLLLAFLLVALAAAVIVPQADPDPGHERRVRAE